MLDTQNILPYIPSERQDLINYYITSFLHDSEQIACKKFLARGYL